MCARWNDEYDANLLASELENLKTVDNVTGTIGFSGTYFDDIMAVLQSSVEFSEVMPEAEIRAIIFGSVFSVAQSGTLTKPLLMAEFNRREHAFKNGSKEPYVMVVSLSSRYFNSMTNAAIGGHRITFSRNLPERFASEHNGVRDRGRRIIFGELPRLGSGLHAYTPVRVSVQARSLNEALELATNTLDLLRGIWNWEINRRSWSRSSGGRRQPVNRLVLGPLYSLHKPGGRLATDVYWFTPDYLGPIQTHRLDNRWMTLRQFEKDVRKLLGRSQYREELEEAIRRYTRALDGRDWNASFLQLWSLLEHLTDTSATGYSATIKRTLFLIPRGERNFQRQILNHLRHYRNRAVHSDYETEEIETLLYQLKRYVEVVLQFHVASSPGFASIAEVAHFLSLPADVAELQRKMGLMRRALELRSGI